MNLFLKRQFDCSVLFSKLIIFTSFNIFPIFPELFPLFFFFNQSSFPFFSYTEVLLIITPRSTHKRTIKRPLLNKNGICPSYRIYSTLYLLLFLSSVFLTLIYLGQGLFVIIILAMHCQTN